MLFGNAIRQGLSISFFMFSIYYLLQKKNIYYAILFLIITTFFHTSTGFVLLLVILIMNSFYLIQRKNPFILLIIIILIRIASYFLAPLFESFGNTYLMKGTGFSYLLHYSFVFFIILYIFYERCKFKDEISAKLFAVFTSLIALSSFVWYNDVTYGRIIYLYYPFLIYFIVYLNKYFEKNIIKIFFIIIFILLGCYFYSSESMVSTLNSEYFNEY